MPPFLQTAKRHAEMHLLRGAPWTDSPLLFFWKSHKYTDNMEDELGAYSGIQWSNRDFYICNSSKDRGPFSSDWCRDCSGFGQRDWFSGPNEFFPPVSVLFALTIGTLQAGPSGFRIKPQVGLGTNLNSPNTSKPTDVPNDLFHFL